MRSGALAPPPLRLLMPPALTPDLVIDPDPMRDLGVRRMSNNRCWDIIEPVGLFCGEHASRYNDAGLPVCQGHLSG